MLHFRLILNLLFILLLFSNTSLKIEVSRNSYCFPLSSNRIAHLIVLSRVSSIRCYVNVNMDVDVVYMCSLMLHVFPYKIMSAGEIQYLSLLCSIQAN